MDEGDDLRNDASLIFQVRFEVEGTQVNYFAVGDSTFDVLEDIVDITKYHKNEDRLDWDLFNIPHHCSAFALSPDKGEKETIPTKKVEELLLHSQAEAYIVSSSNPILPDTADAYKQGQPPHIQAKKAYVKYLEKAKGRKFLVTMEEPNTTNPEPIIFEISGKGCRLIGKAVSGAAAIISSWAPRAG